MRRVSCLWLVCLVVVLPCYAHHIKPGATKVMPVTTSSPKARDLYERAMQDYENLYPGAGQHWVAGGSRG
jgi:hypothetical protein